MKKSTKLNLLGLAQFLAPGIWMLLTVLISKLTGPIMKSSIGSAFFALTSIVVIVLCFKGIWTLIMARGFYEAEKEDPKLSKALIEADRNKKHFRKLIKKLCSLGIAKEIYIGETFSILNFDDLFYLACLYSSIANEEPFGIILTAENAHKFIDNNELLLEFVSNMDDATFSQMTVSLKENHFNNLVKYCEERKDERPTEFIRAEFEKELSDNKLYKRIGFLCVWLSVVSFSILSISELVGALLSAAVVIVGIGFVIRFYKEYENINWKAIIGILFSAFIIIMTIVELPKNFDKNDNSDYISVEHLEPEKIEIPPVTIPDYPETEDNKMPDPDIVNDIIGKAGIQPSILSYTIDIAYSKGTIKNNVYHSDFINLYGRLPEGYSWMSNEELKDVLQSDKYPVEWECGVRGKESSNTITGLFTVYVGADANFDDCIAVLEAINPGYTIYAGGTTIFTDSRRIYRGFSFKSDTGSTRGVSLNKVNDRLVCVFDQYDDNKKEQLSVFCEN